MTDNKFAPHEVWESTWYTVWRFDPVSDEDHVVMPVEVRYPEAAKRANEQREPLWAEMNEQLDAEVGGYSVFGERTNIIGRANNGKRVLIVRQEVIA